MSKDEMFGRSSISIFIQGWKCRIFSNIKTNTNNYVCYWCGESIPLGCSFYSVHVISPTMFKRLKMHSGCGGRCKGLYSHTGLGCGEHKYNHVNGYDCYKDDFDAAECEDSWHCNSYSKCKKQALVNPEEG